MLSPMLDDDACFAAIQARDPRHDGLFFTAVKTTRIYCRPICPARTPLRRNVAFFTRAAQAQEAGYRPCLRCRPESAPDSPAWMGSLASVNRALRLIEEGALTETGVEGLAARLGLTGRHLRRLFVRHLGVGPLQVEQTRRIHLAKTLLHETGLSMTEVAFASGFASLRRFNEAFLSLFGAPPSLIRRRGEEERGDLRNLEPSSNPPPAIPSASPLRLKLHYRPPFDWSAAKSAFAGRLPVQGGAIEGGGYRILLPLEGRDARITLTEGAGRTIELQLEHVPIRHLARVITVVKRDLLLAGEAGAGSIR